MSPADPTGRFGLRHILTQAGWAGLLEVAGIAVRYLLAITIARSFGASGLGLYTLAIAFASAGALIARVGLDRASMRFTALYRAQHDRMGIVGVVVFSTAVTASLSIVGMSALYLIADPIEHAWGQGGLGASLRIISIALPAMALGEVWRDALRGFQDVRLASLLEKVVIPGVTLAAIVAGVALLGSDPSVSITAALIGYWFAALVAGTYLRRDVVALAARPLLRPRTWLAFSIFLSMEGGLLYLLQWTDQLLVGLFLKAEDVGIYAAAIRTAMVAAVPLLAVNTIMGPTVAGLHGGPDPEQLRVTYARLTWATGAAGLVLAIGLIAAGPLILALFGTEFAAGYPVLAIVAIGHMVNSATGSAGVVLGMTGHVRWRLFNALLTAGLNIALNLLLIPAWGIVGSAVATSSSLVVINLLQVAEVRWVLGYWGYDMQQLRFWIDRVRRRGAGAHADVK